MFWKISPIKNTFIEFFNTSGFISEFVGLNKSNNVQVRNKNKSEIVERISLLPIMLVAAFRSTNFPVTLARRAIRTTTNNVAANPRESHDRQIKFAQYMREELHHLESNDMIHHERVFNDNKDGKITYDGKTLINFTSNDYLGLNRNEEVVKAAQYALETHGAGLSSVRFICGTQNIHKRLEKQLAEFHQQDDCVLYPSGYNANVGLFEAITTAKDAIICDEGNHASIIDGTRFSKAKSYLYKHLDLQDLEVSESALVFNNECV